MLLHSHAMLVIVLLRSALNIITYPCLLYGSFMPSVFYLTSHYIACIKVSTEGSYRNFYHRQFLYCLDCVTIHSNSKCIFPQWYNDKYKQCMWNLFYFLLNTFPFHLISVNYVRARVRRHCTNHSWRIQPRGPNR